MKTLILTVGLPQSGKSTWAKKQGHPIVNPDSIRLALHGQLFIKKAEDFVWTIAKTIVKSLFLAGHNAVILDATNITKARRDEWIDNEWGREFHLFPEDTSECINRAVLADRKYLIQIIGKMAGEFELITDDEKERDYGHD